MGLHELVEGLGDLQGMDKVDDVVRARLGRVRATPVWPVLRGRWLGHPLHPVLTDVPIGLWTSAVVLD
ncbi:MAG: hypothetical protein M3O70_03450, partial [Actinomycetota bacterium]|nr:hypothetical protein [Actinomycetota bacterium]